MLKRWLSYPSVQILLCFAVYAVVAYKSWPMGAVWFSPLLAAAIARPLMNLVSNARHAVRYNVWKPQLGQHYVFKDVTIHVIEDEWHYRWVELADARKVVGTIAAERALSVTYPGRVQPMGKAGLPHIRDDALIEHLAKENNPVALRFRTWIDRTIANPASNIRRDAGITHDPVKDGAAD